MDSEYEPVCILKIEGNSLKLVEYSNYDFSGQFDGPFTLTGSSDSDGDDSDEETTSLTYEKVVSSTFVSSWTSQTLTFDDEAKVATLSQYGTYTYTYDETTKTFTLTSVEYGDELTFTINGSSLVSEGEQYTISTVVPDMTLEEALSHSYVEPSQGINLTFTPGATNVEGTATLVGFGEGSYVYDETTKTFTIDLGDLGTFTFTISGNTLTSGAGTFQIAE